MFHTATLLDDGDVLVVDQGLAGDAPPSAERYDPSRGIWTATASPSRARFGYTATLLTNGTVLLLGDYDVDGGTSAELYDPGTGP